MLILTSIPKYKVDLQRKNPGNYVNHTTVARKVGNAE